MLVVEKEARETLSSKRIWHFRKHQDSFSDMTKKKQGSYWYLKRWDFKVAIEEGMRETAKKGLWRWGEVSQDRRKASLWQMCFVLFFLLLFFSLQQILSLYISGMVHTRVEVCGMDSEVSGLVERPWLQLMCCAVCLLYGHNFRWWGEVWNGSECWLVCCHWTPEIEFNKSLSSLIIRLANYSITTSLIYEWKV